MTQQIKISGLELIVFFKAKRGWLIRWLLLVIGINAVLMAAALICYPRMSYDQSTLYGVQDENLKDFSEEDGIITAESTDPWITVPLGRKMGILSVRIFVSDMTSQNSAYTAVSNSNCGFPDN